MEYLSSKEIANKWNITDRQVRSYCKSGRVSGCFLNGKIWMIPENATKPQRFKRSVIKDKDLLKILKEEKEFKIKGRIYHKLQVEMTYNSNHIEGSQLTHDQTILIFETMTLGVINKNIKIDDIIETVNHFKCIDYIIDNAEKKLTETFIKQIHYILKQNTSDSFLNWFKVGDYKILENEVGGNITTSPSNVKKEMFDLLNTYNSKEVINIEDIIDFHQKFETIHPFQDGNGRVGRLIILKECLKNKIVPILIRDDFKDFYYRGLKEYKDQKGYLIDTCLHGQDIFKTYLDYFKIKY